VVGNLQKGPQIMSQFVVAKRDTHIMNMHNMEDEKAIVKGTRMFHITSDKQTRYLEPDEICVYLPEYEKVHFTYKGDWE